jgi:hypothetical protein
MKTISGHTAELVRMGNRGQNNNNSARRMSLPRLASVSALASAMSTFKLIFFSFNYALFMFVISPCFIQQQHAHHHHQRHYYNQNYQNGHDKGGNNASMMMVMAFSMFSSTLPAKCSHNRAINPNLFKDASITKLLSSSSSLALASTKTPPSSQSSTQFSSSSSSPIILKNYNPMEQVVRSKTRKMEWLLRTTSQIITTNESNDDNANDNENTNDNVDNCNQEGMSNSSKSASTSATTTTTTIYHPIGSLPSALITKIPTIMNLWMKRCSIDNSSAAFVVEKLLQRLIDERDAGNEYFLNHNDDVDDIDDDSINEERIISTDLYNIVIEAWMRTSSQDVLHDNANSSNNNNDTNQTATSATIGDASTLSSPFAAIRAHEILYKMEELAYDEENGDLNIRPDTKTYFLVLKAWVRSKEYCSLERMEEILHRLEKVAAYPCNNNNGQYRNVKPTAQCFNLYLYALANSKGSKYDGRKIAKKANRILLDLRKRYEQDPINNRNLMPDVNTYNQILSAIARTRSVKGASKAQGILDDMMSEANVTKVYPDTDTFNAVMGCWHKSGSKKASFHIEYLLNLMNGLSESDPGYHNACPDRYSVNTAIAAIGKSGRKEKLRRAHHILTKMQSLYGVKPDSLSYNLVIDAYAKSRDFRAVNETQRLLATMEESYMNGNYLVMPDSCTYSTVIDTLSSIYKSGAGKKAETIVRRMEKLSKDYGGKTPSTAVYNALMNCYATRSDRKQDLHRLEAILRFMEGMSKAGNLRIKPNLITYNTVLKGYSQSKDNLTKKAETLLERMESRDLQIKPDVISYTTVITAFARSSIPGKASNAKRILDRMITAHGTRKNPGFKLSIYPFNACLNACAFTRTEKLDAFVVVVDTLVLIQKFAKPDSTTYGTVLKAWRNVIPKHDDRRETVVNSTFRQCCKEGLVSQMVIRQLQLASTPETYKELVGRDIKDNIHISSLPHQWSRNSRER